MAKTQSQLLGKMQKRSKGAWSKARNAKAQAKGSQLPGGLVEAVGKITSWKMDDTKKGDPYFMFHCEAMEPEEVSGRKFTKLYVIAETKTKTVDQKLEDFSSDLQLMGLETSELESLNDLPEALDGLVGTFFTFNTWKPDQDRDAMVFIQGLAEDYEEEGEPEEDPEDGEDGEDEGEPEEEEAPFEEEEEEEPEEEEAEGEEEEWEPVKGETYSCKVTPRSKSTDVEITSVNKRQETVNVKRLSDKKVFKGIPWGKLE